MSFSNAEYADIHYVYGFCDGNTRVAYSEYKGIILFNLQSPDYRIFQRITSIFKREDSLSKLPEKMIMLIMM